MKNEKCGIAQLVELAMGTRVVTVIAGLPGSGRTTLLATMVRYAAKSGVRAVFCGGSQPRPFNGMSDDIASRITVCHSLTGANLADALLVAIDTRETEPEFFGKTVRAAKAPGVNAATIIAPSLTKAAYRSGAYDEFFHDHVADVFVSLSRDEKRTDAHVVATVVKHRFEKPGQRFVFRFTPTGLEEVA